MLISPVSVDSFTLDTIEDEKYIPSVNGLSFLVLADESLITLDQINALKEQIKEKPISAVLKSDRGIYELALTGIKRKYNTYIEDGLSVAFFLSMPSFSSAFSPDTTRMQIVSSLDALTLSLEVLIDGGVI